MTTRREFVLSDAQVAILMDAGKPVPLMFLSGGTPMFGTPQENANRAWRALAQELGFKWDTVQPVSGKDAHYFTAEAA